MAGCELNKELDGTKSPGARVQAVLKLEPNSVLVVTRESVQGDNNYGVCAYTAASSDRGAILAYIRPVQFSVRDNAKADVGRSIGLKLPALSIRGIETSAHIEIPESSGGKPMLITQDNMRALKVCINHCSRGPACSSETAPAVGIDQDIVSYASNPDETPECEKKCFQQHATLLERFDNPEKETTLMGWVMPEPQPMLNE